MKLKLRLTIDLDYNTNGVSEVAIKDMLRNVATHAAGTGQFTLDTPAEVERWNQNVEVVMDEDGSFTFSDGSYVEFPDADGTIRRRDSNGNCEEVRCPGDDNWDEWAQLFAPYIRDQFVNGECPDCGESIPYDIGHGEECPNCPHIFFDEQEIAEQVRRDEKRGLHGGLEDPAN